MITYIVYVVTLFIVALILREALASYGRKSIEKESSMVKKYDWKSSIKYHFKRKNHVFYIWPSFLIMIFFVPFIYEFPGITIWTKGYVLNFYSDHSKPSSIEKMNWYGNYRSLDMTSQYCFYIDKSRPNVYEEKTFRISSNIKIVEFKVALEGKDKAQFILEMNNSFKNFEVYSLKSDSEKFIFEELGKNLRESPLPVENLEQSVEQICNDWLDKNRIFSVRVRLLSAKDIPNMDRTVDVF